MSDGKEMWRLTHLEYHISRGKSVHINCPVPFVVEEGYLKAVVESLGLEGGQFVADEL
jgi:hypothetical protein